MKTLTSFSLLGALLLVACGGPAGSPTPSPSGSPTTSPSPSPSPTVSFGPDEISHPTGASDRVLQMESGGGLVPMDFFVTQAPAFSLYGDGTVILRPTQVADDPLPPGSLRPFWEGRLTEGQVQALLRFALGQGRLLDARDNYPQNTCADCGTTVFRINAAGLSKTVSVDALGMVDEPGRDALDRAGFLALAETLYGFEARMRAAELGEVIDYDPPLYRVVLMQAQAGQGEPMSWPWDDVTLDDFVAEGDGFRRDAFLSRDQVALVTAVPSGGQAGIIVEDPAGGLWSLGWRPLLPDEIAAGGGG
jgi:hypothetical protein